MFRFLALLCLSVCLLRADPSEAYANRVASAIYWAEGGKKARKPYGILSVPVRSEAEARQVCLRTIRRRHILWEKAGRPGDFILYLASTYAPVKGVPKSTAKLNRNWPKNVNHFLHDRQRPTPK